MSDDTLIIEANNDVWLHIGCSDPIAHELNDYFVYTIPGAEFVKRQARFRRWDGRIRLFRLKDHRIYRGLLHRVYEFAEAHDYQVENRLPTPKPLLPGNQLDAWIDTLNIPFTVRDYQYAAVRLALDTHRSVIVAPTGSGKSLILYLIQAAFNTKTLIVVPTIGLVGQMIADFTAYGCDEPIHPIQAGAEKHDEARIFVSTWQSLYDMPKDYFEQFQTVIVDEVHLAKAASITGLMEKCLTSPYRFGCTGTLNEMKVHQLQVEGLFGAAQQVTTTTTLVKKSQLSPVLVKMLVLGYPDLMRKQLRHLSYQEEIEFLVTEPSRTEFIVQLAQKLKGCSLLLFGRIQHGKALYERLQSLGCDVHYIAGEVNAEDRETIRQTVTASTQNTIIIGSFGTVQTGINIPGLQNLVFCAPSKGAIRVLQSIGRVLRLADGKSRATVYDIVDDLRIKRRQNFAFRHGEARSAIYAKEHFPVTLHPLSLEAFTLVSPGPLGDTVRNEPDAGAG